MVYTYSYDPNTYEYIKEEPAILDPLESTQQGREVYLLPANSTFTAPPAAKPGFAIVWGGDSWSHIADFRGKIVWKSYDDGMTITELGDIPQGYTLSRPAKPLTAEDFDAAMEQYIYKVRAARGYTTREPLVYLNSSVPRWRQDASDWVMFLDAVMEYGLNVQNDFIETGMHPTLDEFIANLPTINWTYNDEETNE